MFFIILGCSFVSCKEKQKNISVSLDSFANLVESDYTIDAESFGENIRHVVLADRNRSSIDVFVRRYYLDGGQPLWVTQAGVSGKADSVLACIGKVGVMGFSRESFGYTQIRHDLRALRNLDFQGENASLVSARLEYNLTKAFLRYGIGQRFGFMNPREVFNRLDALDTTSVHTGFRSLYGVKLKIAGKDFVGRALRTVHNDDSVAVFLAESKPSNLVYYRLLEALGTAKSRSERQKILCNMERCRWSQDVYPQQFRKYVWVNIPSLSLQAIDEGQVLYMRICLGSLETKTPVLNSHIKRMDFNPQWIIPKSIIRKSVCHHAGDNAYFDNRNYFIRERKTGKTVDPSVATGSMLCSNDYMVIQRGGKGNALGRVIFRFDNDYSIYLHDTSSTGAFSHKNRAVSHGCIRVEKPFELAVFMLADKNERLIDRMKYSMTADYDTRPHENEGNAVPTDRKKMLRSQSVTPEIPVFIAYYTLYPDIHGRLVEFPDIYGYDSVVLDGIKSFMQ